MITIIADDRETNGANPHFGKYIIADNAHFSKKPKKDGGGEIKLCVNRVTTGDYIIKIENIISLIIERKTWQDLAASFKDGRMATQHKEMLSVQDRTGCLIMYIIEGKINYDKDTKVGRIPFANLDAKRRHLILRGNGLIQTKDQEHTAEMIVNLARDVWRMYQSKELEFHPKQKPAALTVASYQKELADLQLKYRTILENENPKPALSIIDKTPIQIPEYIEYVDDLDDGKIHIMEKPTETPVTDSPLTNFVTGGKTPSSMEDHLALLDVHAENTLIPAILTEKKIKSDADIIERMWIAIPGISSRSAPTLMEKYTLSDLITADSARRKHLLKEIAELKYASGRRLGDDMAKKVMVLSYTGTGVTILDKVKNISADIMAEIPGVTKDTAKKILEHYSLRQICSGEVNEDSLAAIKKGNRTVGRLVAGKILELL